MENQQQIPPTPPNPPSPPSEPPIAFIPPVPPIPPIPPTPPMPPIPPTPPTPPEPPMPPILPASPIQPIQPIQLQILTLPGIGNLLKRSWQIYKSRFWIFLGIMFIPLLTSLVIRIFAAVFAISIAGLLLNFRNLNLWIIIPSFFAAILVILFLSFILTIWPQASLLYTIKEREQKIGIKESFAKGWHKIISYWWIYALSSFIVMGGSVLLIIPGIIFAIWFSLALYVLVAEDLKGMNALFRSKQLVADKWWSVLWRILIITLIVMAFSIGIQSLGDIFNYKNIGSIISSIVVVLFTPLFIAYSFLIYEDLKEIKKHIPFEAPKKSTKIKFILVGVVGLLLIPAILGGVVMTSLSGTRERARDARRMADLSSIRFAAEMYYDDNNIYPSTLNDLTPYLYGAEIPTDPKTNLLYQYMLLENGNNFEICADFEKDLQKKANNCLDADGQWVSKGMLGVTPTPRTDETANWQTYKNDKYGFEIKYPETWRGHINAFLGEPNMIFCPPEFFSENSGAWMSWTNAPDGKGCASVRRMWSRANGNILIEGIGEVSPEVYKNNWEEKLSQPVLSILLLARKTESKSANINRIYLGKDSDGLYWYLDFPSSGFLEYKPTFEKILSTFKFLEDETASWQTYRNEEYEFKYPSNWHMFGSGCLNPEGVGPDYCTVAIELSRKNIQETLNEKKTEYSGFVFEESTIFVDGAERFLLTIKDPFKLTAYKKIAFLENNGLIYIFSGGGEKWPIINQILSTFRFLK